MIYSIRPLLLAAVALTSCQTTGPQKALDDYRSAVVQKDASLALSLCDQKTQMMWAELGEAPDDFRLGLEAQSATTAVVRQSMHYELSDGTRLVVGLEDGVWKVQQRLHPVTASTPEQALRIFVAAALAGRLDVVRTFIPVERRDAYTSDSHLSAHLDTTKDRLRALREALPKAPSARRVRPDYAEIVWAAGRTAKLQKESDGWKVLDLE